MDRIFSVDMEPLDIEGLEGLVHSVILESAGGPETSPPRI